MTYGIYYKQTVDGVEIPIAECDDEEIAQAIIDGIMLNLQYMDYFHRNGFSSIAYKRKPLNLSGTVLNDTDIDFKLETENEFTKNQKAGLYKAIENVGCSLEQYMKNMGGQ